MSFVPGNFLPENFLPDDFLPEGATELTFIGPDIADLSLRIGTAMSPRNYASRFASPNAMTFSVVGTLPDGLSLSSEGVLSGTPTTLGTTSSLEIRADDGSTTADSNSFSIHVVEQTAQFGGVGAAGVARAAVGRLSVGNAGVGA